MTFDDINKFVMLILALSLASERLVEIIKGYYPSIAVESTDPATEQKRKASISALSIIAGLVTGALAGFAIEGETNFQTFLLAGFLASGGSAFWSSVVGYLGQIKNLKKAEVQERKAVVARALAGQPTVDLKITVT